MSSDLEAENIRLKSQVETFKELLAVTEEVVSIKTEELRKSNQKLHDTHDYIAAIIDNMADGLLVIDTKDVITRVNPALNRMLRKAKEDLTDCQISTGRHIQELDIPALTVTVPADTSTMPALMVTFAEAFTVIPLVSSLTELPLLS